MADQLKAELLRIGGKYNWKGQAERLVYLGMCEPRNGKWHQFAKIESPSVVWCEVLPNELNCLEETNTRAEPVGVPTVQAGMEKPLDGWAITMQEGGNIFVESPSGDSAHVFMDDISPLAEVTRQLLQTLAFGSYAAPSQPVAAQSKALTDDLVDWDRISEAAKQACNEYGQWMPERWLQLFVNAYNRNKS